MTTPQLTPIPTPILTPIPTPLELAIHSAPRLTTRYTNYTVLSHGTVVLTGGPTDQGGPLDASEGATGAANYECPEVRSLNKSAVETLARDHPEVYKVLQTGGFPYRGVTPRRANKSGPLVVVEWLGTAGGQVAHIVEAYTESSAEAFASKAYVDDYLSPVVAETGRYLED